MRCKQSIEEKFEELYLKYKNDVYRTSLRITKNECEAEEITQKIFCKVFEFFEHVDEEQLHAYLVRAATNMSLNWLRDTKREREGVCYEDFAETAPLVESAEATYLEKERKAEEEVLSSELMRRLYEENETWYHAINLVYCLGVSHDHTAKMMGISKSVLYSKIYRAKKWLSKHFDGEYKKL